jgi:hypothetical protein
VKRRRKTTVKKKALQACLFQKYFFTHFSHRMGTNRGCLKGVVTAVKSFTQTSGLTKLDLFLTAY